MTTAALVLAGGTIRPDRRDQWEGLLDAEVWNPALARLGSSTLLEQVAQVLNDSVDGRVLVAGDVPLPDHCVPVDGGETMVDTLLNGIAALNPSETRLLVATADIPFVTPDSVRHFLDNAPDADFVYSIVPAELCAEALPGMTRTTLRTAEGVFTGGNIVLVNPDFVRSNADRIRDAYARRKDVVALARLLGPGIVLRLIASRLVPAALPIRALEAAVGRLVSGADVRAFPATHFGIGSDIDRPDDLRLARKLMLDRGSRP